MVPPFGRTHRSPGLPEHSAAAEAQGVKVRYGFAVTQHLNRFVVLAAMPWGDRISQVMGFRGEAALIHRTGKDKAPETLGISGALAICNGGEIGTPHKNTKSPHRPQISGAHGNFTYNYYVQSPRIRIVQLKWQTTSNYRAAPTM